MTTHTIATAWVKIDGEDRLRIGIDLEHDFATIYLHPETVESLRVALGAIPAREAEIRSWDVVFGDGEEVTLTTRQIDVLRHALGISTYRCKPYRDGSGFGERLHRERFSVPYRNYFYPGGDNVGVCESLFSQGLMSTQDGKTFYVTIQGERAVFTQFATLGVKFKRKWGYYQ